MRTQFSKFALAAILGFALTFTFSCSGGGGEVGGGGSSSPSSGGSIVNADNEAWVRYRNGDCREAFIFKQNGEYSEIKCENWCIKNNGTYSIKGNQLRILNEDYHDYSISGNTLTIIVSDGDDFIFTRTSNVYVSGACGGK